MTSPLGARYEGASIGGSRCAGTPGTNDMCVGVAISRTGTLEGPWDKITGPFFSGGKHGHRRCGHFHAPPSVHFVRQFSTRNKQDAMQMNPATHG